MTLTYQTYTTTVTLTNAATVAAFDAFWLAPFCPDASGDVQGYASRLQALWESAATRQSPDAYLVETVECPLSEGVNAGRIDWTALAQALISDHVSA